MTANILELQETARLHLSQDTTLSFVDTFAALPYDPEFLPDFERYALIVSPASLLNETIANQYTQELDRLEVYCIVQNWDPVLSVQGTAPGEIGVVKLVYLVQESLRAFGFQNKESLDILGDELEGVVDLKKKVVFPGLDGYFRVACVPWKGRLKSRVENI